MTDDDINNAGTFEAEFRRQMRSGQVRRFVRALPAFGVQHDTPDRFALLLQELEEAQEQAEQQPIRVAPRHN